jgi:hypothetical protein
MPSVAGAIATGRTTIDRVTVCVCAGELESDTVTLNVDVPLAVGVPETKPLLERFNPAGRLPDVIDQM